MAELTVGDVKYVHSVAGGRGVMEILTGDCLEVIPTLAPSSVDLVLADLPYGKTRNEWDSIIDLDTFWERIRYVSKPVACTLLFATQPFATDLIVSNRKAFRYDIVWRKNKSTGHLNAKKMPLRTHELILVFGSGAYNPQMTEGHRPVNSFYTRTSGTTFREAKTVVGGGSTQRYPVSVIDYPVVNNNDGTRIHPSQKPEDLLRYLIRQYSNPGDTVLDPVVGSGSTVLAAHKEGRKGIGIELKEEIAEAARSRLLAQQE